MSTLTRAKIIRDDLALYDGKTAIYTRPDATGGTTSGLRIGDDVDVLQVFGEGSKRTRNTIAQAIQFIGSSVAALRFSPGTWTIDDDLTIPATMPCLIKAGCVFNVSTGKTLTFSGPVFVEYETWTSGTGSVLTNDGAAGFPNY